MAGDTLTLLSHLGVFQGDFSGGSQVRRNGAALSKYIMVAKRGVPETWGLGTPQKDVKLEVMLRGTHCC